MKNKLTLNLGLKLISVLFAFVLWLIVVNVDDPMMTKKFKDIPVNILNENLLEEQGQVYEVMDNSATVTITVKAKRSVIESLSKSDFYASADFAERITANNVPIKVRATKNENKISDINLDNNTVKIMIESKENKQVPVELHLKGTTADGFTVGSTHVNPNNITITGPASEISKVAKVVLQADVSGLNADTSVVLTGVLCNAAGEAVDETRIEKSVEQYQADIKLLHTKSVDLDFAVEGEVASGYRYISMEYTPTTVSIAGEEKALSTISTLEIPSSELNIAGATGNVIKKVDISKYLPSGLQLSNSVEKEIQVTLKVQRMESKTLTFPVSAIDVLNTPVGLDMTFDYYDTVSVIVQGLSQDLDRITSDDIHLSVDLKGKQAGLYYMETAVTVPDGYTISAPPTVRVLLKSRSTTDSVSTQMPATSDVTQETIQSSQPSPTVQPTAD